MTKGMACLAITVGGMLGAYIPVLFGADSFGLLSISGSVIGGLTALYTAYKFST